MSPLTADERGIYAQRRSLKRVQILATCSVLAILLPWYGLLCMAFFRKGTASGMDFLVPLFFSPLWLPPLFAGWRLRERSDIFKLKSALSTAAGWSLFAFLLSVVALVTLTTDVPWTQAQFPIVIGLLQIGLFVSSVQCYRRIFSASGETQLPWTGLGVGLVAAFPFCLLYWNLFLHERPHQEASAVGSLRTIVTAQTEYSLHHPEQGFAGSLTELGPASREYLIDSYLAAGKKSGYTITMTPGPPDIEGRITTFYVIARPEKFSKNTSPSFFSDETGILRFTKENRPPTSLDPLLQ